MSWMDTSTKEGSGRKKARGKEVQGNSALTSSQGETFPNSEIMSLHLENLSVM